MIKPDLRGLGALSNRIPKKLRAAFCAVFAVLLVASAAIFGVSGLSAAAKDTRTALKKHVSAAPRNTAPNRKEKAESKAPVKPAPPGKTLPVKNISQLPELKAGCEVTSAAIVLNYLGYAVTKTDLVGDLNIDSHFGMENGKLYGPDPWISFAGSPTDKYGCYAPVITNMANRYLRSVKAERKATDISGEAPSALYSHIDDGLPVIVWATTNLEEPSSGPEWYLNDTGEKFQWILKEHCLVLTGYTEKTAVFCDPLDGRGTVTYDRSLFERRYSQMYSQAVLIR